MKTRKEKIKDIEAEINTLSKKLSSLRLNLQVLKRNKNESKAYKFMPVPKGSKPLTKKEVRDI